MFQIEDFTDRSQNVSRAVGETQIPKIMKCIELSIFYLFEFMNGSVQEPKLRKFLFGPDANEEKPELPLVQPPRAQLLDGRREVQHSISSNHTSKQAHTAVRLGEKRWQRTNSDTMGDAQQDTLSNPTLNKRMRTAGGGWGEMPSESWRATSNGSWGGTTWGQWGRNQRPATPDPMRTGYALPTVSWQCRLDSGGMQPAISAGPIRGGIQEGHLISRIPNQAHASSSSLQQPNVLNQALNFDRLRSIDEVVPAPYAQQNPGQGLPYNPYATR